MLTKLQKIKFVKFLLPFNEFGTDPSQKFLLIIRQFRDVKAITIIINPLHCLEAQARFPSK